MRVFYSGHGQIITGFFCLKDSVYLSLQQLLNQITIPEGGELELVLDMCYASRWVEQAEQIKNNNAFPENLEKLTIYAFSGCNETLDWGEGRKLLQLYDRKGEPFEEQCAEFKAQFKHHV